MGGRSSVLHHLKNRFFFGVGLSLFPQDTATETGDDDITIRRAVAERELGKERHQSMAMNPEDGYRWAFAPSSQHREGERRVYRTLEQTNLSLSSISV
jgi:hypothetical protein